MVRRKEEVIDQWRSWIEWETQSGACIIAMPHQLNSTEMSQEEFWDNLRFWYGLIPLNLPID